jgi:adenylate kinase
VNIILMGPPGVGKGTQSQRLSSERGIPVIATGDMFRKLRQDDTPLARQVMEYMNRGEYVPDELTIKMVLRRLNNPDTKYGFLLDGFPRTVAQAEALDRAFANDGRRIDHVILMCAPDETVLQRLAGRWICSNCGRVYNELSNPPRIPGICDVCGGSLFQREDESKEVQRKRLQVYTEQTEPVAQYYRDRDRLIEVDARASVDDVSNQLRDILDGSR